MLRATTRRFRHLHAFSVVRLPGPSSLTQSSHGHTCGGRSLQSSARLGQQFGRGQLGDMEAIRRRRQAKKAIERVSKKVAVESSNDLTGKLGKGTSEAALDASQEATIMGTSKTAFVGDPRYASVHMRGSVVESVWFGKGADQQDVTAEAHEQLIAGNDVESDAGFKPQEQIPTESLERPSPDAELLYFRWTQPFMLRASLLPVASCGLLGLGALVAKFIAPAAMQPAPIVPGMLLATAATVFWLCRRVALATPKDLWLADGGHTLVWRSQEYPMEGAGSQVTHNVPVQSLYTAGAGPGNKSLVSAPEDADSVRVLVRGLERLPPLELFLPGGLPAAKVNSPAILSQQADEQAGEQAGEQAAEHARRRKRHAAGVFVADGAVLAGVTSGDTSTAMEWHAEQRQRQV